MRLGDLDALKDRLKELLKTEPSSIYGCGLRLAIENIDNAPTVFSCNACKNMGNERECVDCHNYSNYVHYEERPQGEYKTACNVLLSLEQIVRKSDGWEDSAVEAVHNAVETAIKCMSEYKEKTDENS